METWVQKIQKHWFGHVKQMGKFRVQMTNKSTGNITTVYTRPVSKMKCCPICKDTSQQNVIDRKCYEETVHAARHRQPTGVDTWVNEEDTIIDYYRLIGNLVLSREARPTKNLDPRVLGVENITSCAGNFTYTRLTAFTNSCIQ